MEQYGPPCSLCGSFNHFPKHCYKGEHDINNVMEKMSINPNNKVIYSNNGGHDNPHEPPQNELEGCDTLQNTLYSHYTNIPHDKLYYIYQHFQDNEKMHKLDPETEITVPDGDSLYPYINSDIEYRLFEDIVATYYLDSQIKDDFQCDHDCYSHQ